MSIERKFIYVLEQAKELAKNVTTWADFSVALFDQRNGIVSRTFKEPMEKQAFYDSDQYKVVSQILLDIMKKHGVENGATPQKSGRFMVRVPRTLHSGLEIEAKREGVSLNQLAVSKLSVPLQDSLDLSANVIAEAFTRIYDGYSTDRVIVDPNLNAKYLAICRKLGLANSDFELNHALMDVRKSKKAVLPRCTKRTEFRDYDDYQFASEIAIRILQRTKGVTLDEILCDPGVALEFDNIAKQLAPGQSALKLRCAALNIRKTHRLGPSKKGPLEVAEFEFVSAGPLRTLIVPEIPAFPAAYVLFDIRRPIFAGETDDLRRRIDLHMRGGLPKWLGADEGFDLALKYSAAPVTNQETRKAWQSKYVLAEKPLLNFQKVA
jgi:site-specific DNA-methyltransferase (adenine-specific)